MSHYLFLWLLPSALLKISHVHNDNNGKLCPSSKPPTFTNHWQTLVHILVHVCIPYWLKANSIFHCMLDWYLTALLVVLIATKAQKKEPEWVTIVATVWGNVFQQHANAHGFSPPHICAFMFLQISSHLILYSLLTTYSLNSMPSMQMNKCVYHYRQYGLFSSGL